jgi:hypothetical protein
MKIHLMILSYNFLLFYLGKCGYAMHPNIIMCATVFLYPNHASSRVKFNTALVGNLLRV